MNFGRIIGESPALQKMLARIEAVAQTSASVLIQGESGVGKELVAHVIHARSPRSEGPLVKVNCASIPHELFESEFFGHVKGAFTGAHRDRVGRFELADGGTIFLDEVGEIPLDLQSKLLRVLQESEYERVGDDRTHAVDVRVIAATNRDLEQAVADGPVSRGSLLPAQRVPDRRAAAARARQRTSCRSRATFSRGRARSSATRRSRCRSSKPRCSSATTGRATSASSRT